MGAVGEALHDADQVAKIYLLFAAPGDVILVV
jgi:hypothetical protein